MANTFVNYKEVEDYFLFCLDNDIKFDIIEAQGNYGSVHGVPDYAIERMKSKWESLATIKEKMKNELENLLLNNGFSKNETNQIMYLNFKNKILTKL